MNLLQYLPGDSFLHRLNPVTKLLAAFLFGIAAIISRSVPFILALILFLLAVSFGCGLGKRALSLTKNLLVLGAMMFVLQLFFVRSGLPLVKIGSLTLFTTGGLSSAATAAHSLPLRFYRHDRLPVRSAFYDRISRYRGCAESARC